MSIKANGFTVNLTNTVTLPELSYINELARVRDFEFGGTFKKVPAILEDLYYLYEQERDLCDEFKIEDELFTRETIKENIERDLNESEEAYYKYTLKFLQGLSYASCPGFSPMDKALNTIMYMTHLSDDGSDKYDGSNKNTNSKKVLDEAGLNSLIEEMSKGVDQPGEEKGSEGNKKNGQETSKDVISCVRDFLYDLSPSIANIYGKDKIADVPINMKILRDIKIKSYLKEGIGLGTSLETKLIENNRSNKKRIKPMSSHSQLMKGSKTQMVLPNFDDKLAKKELTIKEKVLPETRKQIVTLLLDDSGSMNGIMKQSYVRAALMVYLEGVMKGTCEVNFYLYESNRYGYKKVKTLKDAQDLYKNISLRRPGGGGTHIGYILQETIDEICSDTSYHDPEITIMLDGDDHVDPKTVNCKGVRINALAFGTTNPGLEKICAESGGVYTVESLYNRY